MKRALPVIFLGLFLISHNLYASNDTLFYRYSIKKPVVVNAAGDTLLNPWAGGLNQPQFSMIELNGDGLKDLLVFDRSGSTTLTFIVSRTKSGEITYLHDPRYELLFPPGSDILLLRDYDRDGHEDAFFRDPRDFYIKLARNKGNNTFTLPDTYLKAYNFGNKPFDSSNFVLWTGNLPAIDDIDADTDIDFITADLFGSELTLYLNNTKENNKNLHPASFEIPDHCLGYLSEETNQLKLNSRCDFDRVYRYNKKHNGSKTLSFFDMDNDGDADLLFGNTEDTSNSILVLVNGKSDFETSIDTFIKIDTAYFSQQIKNLIPMAPAGFFLDINQDGKTDLILAGNETQRFDYPVKEIDQVLFLENNSTTNVPDFQYRTNNFMLDEMIDAGGWGRPVLWDEDKDGDDDLLLVTNGNHAIDQDKKDRIVFYRNTGTLANPVFIFENNDLWNISQHSFAGLVLSFGDLNGDNIEEMICGSENGKLYLFENKGSISNPNYYLKTNNAFGISVEYASYPQIIDLDRDGLKDLVIGCIYGNVFWFKNAGNSTTPAFVLQNDSLGKVFSNELLYDNPTTYHNLGYSAPYIADLDNDGKFDMLLGGLDGKLSLYKNIEKNLNDSFTKAEAFFMDFSDKLYHHDFGAKVSPFAVDIDNDKVPDLFVGTARGGVQYMKGNTSILVGIEDKTQHTISIYPNPAYDQLHIEHLPPGRFLLKVYDITGMLTFSQTVENPDLIDLKTLSTGFYTLIIEGGNFRYQGKFIVLR
jgi:hypothetical protein